MWRHPVLPARKAPVAHKPFVDMRAYVFTRDETRPKRFRFHASGLVLAPAEAQEIVVQDHRETIRSKRSDAFSGPMAQSSRGWTFSRREGRDDYESGAQSSLSATGIALWAQRSCSSRPRLAWRALFSRA